MPWCCLRCSEGDKRIYLRSLGRKLCPPFFFFCGVALTVWQSRKGGLQAAVPFTMQCVYAVALRVYVGHTLSIMRPGTVAGGEGVRVVLSVVQCVGLGRCGAFSDRYLTWPGRLV